jgi:hypothetical protein
VARAIAVLVAVLTALGAAAWCGAGSATAQGQGVTISATINGQDVAGANGSTPVVLDPEGWADVTVTLTNTGTAAVDVRRVNLAGRVLGLTFFSYATTVDLTVAPGATETLRYRLDLTDLAGQATGLMGGTLTVTDADRNAIAELPTVTDVRGSLLSVYGLFGIAIALLTALAVLDTALALAKHRLSINRWQRGLRFLGPGVGIGLVLVFSASVARLWVPELGLWLVVAGLTAAVSFALGYFSPTPIGDEDDFDDDSDTEALFPSGVTQSNATESNATAATVVHATIPHAPDSHGSDPGAATTRAPAIKLPAGPSAAPATPEAATTQAPIIADDSAEVTQTWSQPKAEDP